LNFAGAGLEPYSSTNDLIGIQLRTLNLNRPAQTETVISGNALDFRTPDDIDSIVQSGAGAVTINNGLIATNEIQFAGNGNGVVTLNGAISGAGALRFDRGLWKLTNATSTFQGGIIVRTAVEVAALALDGGSIDLTSEQSILGAGGITINGGTLKLTTAGSGGIAFSTGERVVFNQFGGVLDLRNSNADDPVVQGGQIVSGDLLVMQNGLNNTAVIRFNGGQLGLSQNSTVDGMWNPDGNTLRISQFSGSSGLSGSLTIELDNGAYYSASTAPLGRMIIRGTAGGDPTSGLNATGNTGVGRNFGRFGIDDLSALNYQSGLRFEDAVEVSITGSSRQILGNITIAGGNTGHPGYVAFGGRGTGTGNQLASALTTPGLGGL